MPSACDATCFKAVEAEALAEANVASTGPKYAKVSGFWALSCESGTEPAKVHRGLKQPLSCESKVLLELGCESPE